MALQIPGLPTLNATSQEQITPNTALYSGFVTLDGQKVMIMVRENTQKNYSDPYFDALKAKKVDMPSLSYWESDGTAPMHAPFIIEPKNNPEQIVFEVWFGTLIPGATAEELSGWMGSSPAVVEAVKELVSKAQIQ